MDEIKFDEVVDTYYAPLYRFAISLSRSEPAAADLTQQTFYLWATRGHQLRDCAKVKSWLFTTLYREYLAHRRVQLRFVPEDSEREAAELPTGDQSAFDSMDGAAVLAALQELSDVYRAPLTLFYLQELSYREIASALNIRTGTVMSRLSRGKAMLRKMVCGKVRGERRIFSRKRGKTPEVSPSLEVGFSVGPLLCGIN